MGRVGHRGHFVSSLNVGNLQMKKKSILLTCSVVQTCCKNYCVMLQKASKRPSKLIFPPCPQITLNALYVFYDRSVM